MRWIHRCICMVLGTLVGCETYSVFSPEYGVPPSYSKLRIDGRVSIADSGLPIPGIEVRLAGIDTVLTNPQGMWSMADYSVDPAAVSLESLFFVDVDGMANLGLFIPDSHALDPSHIIGGNYIEHDIFVSLSDAAAEYGPPPATRLPEKR